MIDPFMRLTHIYVEVGRLRTTPLFLKPEDIKEFYDGTVCLGTGDYTVQESAEEIKKLLLAKLDENRQNQVMHGG